MRSSQIAARRYYASRVPGAKRFPNAAEKRSFLEFMVDILLASAITTGFLVLMIYCFIVF